MYSICVCVCVLVDQGLLCRPASSAVPDGENGNSVHLLTCLKTAGKPNYKQALKKDNEIHN
jgi:hypothetical protein